MEGVYRLNYLWLQAEPKPLDLNVLNDRLADVRRYPLWFGRDPSPWATEGQLPA